MLSIKEILELEAGGFTIQLSDVTKKVIRTLVAEAVGAQRQDISVDDRLPTARDRVFGWNGHLIALPTGASK